LADLASVVAERTADVDRRVRRGGRVYRSEVLEIRRAAAALEVLVPELDLGDFVGPVGGRSGKPQLLLRFTGPRDEHLVLKVYGTKVPAEAVVQSTWHAGGVPVVPVLRSGDEPTSWILMPLVDGVPPLLETTAGAVWLTQGLATHMAMAHRCSFAQDPAFTRLGEAISPHLRVAVEELRRRGFPVTVEHHAAAAACLDEGTPSVLHGDLAPTNLLVEVADDRGRPTRVRILDARGYLGDVSFDGARWAARCGGPSVARRCLEEWMAIEPGVDERLALRMLGSELLMQAGVAELIKREGSAPGPGVDPAPTAASLAAAEDLLG